MRVQRTPASQGQTADSPLTPAHAPEAGLSDATTVAREPPNIQAQEMQPQTLRHKLTSPRTAVISKPLSGHSPTKEKSKTTRSSQYLIFIDFYLTLCLRPGVILVTCFIFCIILHSKIVGTMAYLSVF